MERQQPGFGPQEFDVTWRDVTNIYERNHSEPINLSITKHN